MGSQGVVLSRDKRWRKTPPAGPFAIDWNHPMTVGLALLWVPAHSTYPQFGAKGAQTTDGSNGSTTSSKYGLSSPNRINVDITATDRLFSKTSVSPCSIAWVGKVNPTGNEGAGAVMFGWYPNKTDTSPYVMASLQLNTTSFYLGFAWGTTFQTIGPNAKVANDYVMVGTLQASSQILYFNGGRVASGTYALNTAVSSIPAPHVSLGYDVGSSTRTSDESTALAAIWTRVLSPNEVAEFSDNPFCFLRY